MSLRSRPLAASSWRTRHDLSLPELTDDEIARLLRIKKYETETAIADEIVREWLAVATPEAIKAAKEGDDAARSWTSQAWGDLPSASSSGTSENERWPPRRCR